MNSQYNKAFGKTKFSLQDPNEPSRYISRNKMIKERISQIHVLKLQANIKPKKEHLRKVYEPSILNTWDDAFELPGVTGSPQLPKI